MSVVFYSCTDVTVRAADCVNRDAVELKDRITRRLSSVVQTHLTHDISMCKSSKRGGLHVAFTSVSAGRDLSASMAATWPLTDRSDAPCPATHVFRVQSSSTSSSVVRFGQLQDRRLASIVSMCRPIRYDTIALLYEVVFNS